MGKRRNYELCKGTTYKIGVIDTKFAEPMKYRLQCLYEKKLKEKQGDVSKVRIKKFARFIGKIFDIPVPRIRVIKNKKIEKVFKQTGILGLCVVEENKCKEIWLEKEMVKSGDGKLTYFVLLHELRHCWQGEYHYDYYYGKKEDTKELQAFREVDAQAFTELVYYYLFGEGYSYEEATPEEKKEREQIEAVKDEIRMDLWKQIKHYYFWHGDIRTFWKVKKMDREAYRNREK